LKLYGKRGRFVEDPRVISLLEDQKPPPVNSDEAKRLLRLLRDVDDAWRNDRSGPLLNGIALPEPSGSKPRPYSTSPEKGEGPSSSSSSSKGAGHNLTMASSPRQYYGVRPASASKLEAVASGSKERGSADRDTPRYLSRGKAIFMD